MTVAATTAEWLCTRCGTVNRKLLAVGTTEARDRCGSCSLAHVVRPGERLVRWTAARAS